MKGHGQCLVSMLWTALSIGIANSQDIELSTSLGLVLGIQREGYAEFNSLPYTEDAPIGDKRFALSALRESSYSGDSYDATYTRSACVQFGDSWDIEDTGEDCLFLDVLTPNIDENDTMADADDLLPVIAFVHGGAFSRGSKDFFRGEPFMDSGDVVYVAMNYRLGALGFLSVQSIMDENSASGGMNGFHDVIVALQWIQEYISDFGGDRDRVTLMGQSAGAYGVCQLSFSPRAGGLFKQVIIQSGHCNSYISHSEDTATTMIYNDAVLTHLDIVADSDLATLRAADAAALQGATGSLLLPAVDGYVLPEAVRSMLGTGSYTLVPDKMMVGHTTLDSVVAYPYSSYGYITEIEDEQEYQSYLSLFLENSTQAEAIDGYYALADYPPSTFDGVTYSDQTMRWFSMNADVCFVCAGIDLVEQLLTDPVPQIWDSDVFVYRMQAPGDSYYLPHGGDVAYLFYADSPYDQERMQSYDVSANPDFSRLLVDEWVNFAKNGEPSSSLTDQDWSPFDSSSSVMVFGGETLAESTVADYDRCAYWLDNVGWETSSTLCLQSMTMSPTLNPTVEPTVHGDSSESSDSTVSVESSEESSDTSVTLGSSEDSVDPDDGSVAAAVAHDPGMLASLAVVLLFCWV